jgi:hypothetical protein
VKRALLSRSGSRDGQLSRIPLYAFYFSAELNVGAKLAGSLDDGFHQIRVE